MKTAKMQIAVIEFLCPDCDENLQEPNTGSFLFEAHQPMPDSAECVCCGKQVKIPAKAKKIAKGFL
jgi:hypothetical protein